ncbi:MAG: zinc transporter ZntB [Proteobacteria bacterium]|nr:MAG: zinc transporter ZntB [Pseudomonadota bacterium]QKK11187.1 MAG: zinc transporter ZntB [Pseudomonadota bacterium]
MTTNSGDGLICAFLLDQQGGGTPLDWEQASAWQPDQGVLWVHMDYSAPRSQQWIKEQSGLDEIIQEALLATETRPRCVHLGEGLIITLRGVNLNPGSDPEDMVSIRLWADSRRIISLRHRRLIAVQEIGGEIRAGRGPRSSAEFLVEISERLVDRMADVIQSLDEQVDDLEEAVLTEQSHQLRPKLAQIRRQAIMLRRYLAPQREALARIHGEKLNWLGEREQLQLREIADRTTRYVEDLDSARERAAVTQEELNSRLSEQMDRRMYVISIVAALFLPLGFLTGLLGINVGGIPGADAGDAFFIVTAAMAVLVGLQLVLFKWWRWF